MAITIRIDVDKAGLLAKLEMFKGELQAGFLPAFMKIASALHAKEVAAAPIDTGRLIANIKTKAKPFGVDSSSKAIDPRNGYNYARIQHDGGMASGWAGPHYISGKRYMTGPLQQMESYTVDTISDEIDSMIARCGLK